MVNRMLSLHDMSSPRLSASTSTGLPPRVSPLRGGVRRSSAGILPSGSAAAERFSLAAADAGLLRGHGTAHWGKYVLLLLLCSTYTD